MIGKILYYVNIALYFLSISRIESLLDNYLNSYTNVNSLILNIVLILIMVLVFVVFFIDVIFFVFKVFNSNLLLVYKELFSKKHLRETTMYLSGWLLLISCIFIFFKPNFQKCLDILSIFFIFWNIQSLWIVGLKERK